MLHMQTLLNADFACIHHMHAAVPLTHVAVLTYLELIDIYINSQRNAV